MWFWGYVAVGFLMLFWLPGISIIMLFLFPVLLIGHSFITGVIDGSRNRRAAREAANQFNEPQGSEQLSHEDVKPSVDAALLSKRSEESFELARQQEIEAAEAQASSEQSFSHHHEVLSSSPAEEFTSWQDRLEAEARG